MSETPNAKESVVDRIGTWVTHNERSIAVLSGLATALSLLFAAISALASVNQLRLINQERMTPYRAILYNAKMTSYQDISKATAQFQSELVDGFYALDEYGTNYQNTPQDVRYKTLKISAKRVVEVRNAFFQTLRSNKGFWPNRFSEMLEATTVKGGEAASCFSMIAFNLSEDGSLVQNCDATGDRERFEVWIHQLDGALRGDLQSDRLQVIDPK